MKNLGSLVIWLVSVSCFAGEVPLAQSVSLSELGQQADVVAVVQVKDTDYVYRRNFPVGGTAYLQVLIGYKMAKPGTLIEVVESGMHKHECYFPNPDVFEEGRRYLVFLKSDTEPTEQLKGLDSGCAIDILVDADNRYQVRLPVTGFDLADDLLPLSDEVVFRDPYAQETEHTLNSTQRQILLNQNLIRESPASAKEQPGRGALGAPEPAAAPRQWVYTRGVELTTARKLIWPE